MAAQLAMAAGESSVPHTVIWDARGIKIKVAGSSAFRSDTYKSYYRSPIRPIDKEEAFYLDWTAQDVHEFLDALRDSPELNRTNLSINVSNLANYLLTDVESHQSQMDEKKRSLELETIERIETVAVLTDIASRIKIWPSGLPIWRFDRSKRVATYNCAELIPKAYSLEKLSKYLSAVPIDEKRNGKWKWATKHDGVSGLYIICNLELI
ncbi:MAG: hypothetical protein Hyperionvirus28_17 [Hyperionvirus sp.]|uniref:Uncharacterized protein n=1 Tax=Hyperionvirus sp. TaxID=2487770 RepID=A0A3G5AGK7_9VIRU|nr:MAG: hypothetical protein Hyperionvirus28_17 [Hyperionvirus sp.]